MYDYAADIARFIQRLRDNPHVRLIYSDFSPLPSRIDPAWLENFAPFLAEKYGAPFPLPPEDRQLLGFPRQFDIAWETTPGQPLADGHIDFMCGCLNLRSLSTAFAEPTYNRLHNYPAELLADKPLLRIATLFDSGSRANTTNYLTYLLYDKRQRSRQRRYQGLAIEYGTRMLPLPLSIGEYVRAGLRWHGGWGWHFLYLPLDDFRSLDGSTLLTLYKLSEGLPELFPDADWSVIADKQDYFDIARPHALHYREQWRGRR